MAQFNLQTVNVPNQPYTYTIASKDIDITLISGGLASKPIRWTVIPNKISSDHRPLLITIDKEERVERLTERRLNVKRSNWPVLKERSKD